MLTLVHKISKSRNDLKTPIPIGRGITLNSIAKVPSVNNDLPIRLLYMTTNQVSFLCQTVIKPRDRGSSDLILTDINYWIHNVEVGVVNLSKKKKKYSFFVHQEKKCDFQIIYLKRRNLHFICWKKINKIAYNLNETFHFMKVFHSTCHQWIPYIQLFSRWSNFCLFAITFTSQKYNIYTQKNHAQYCLLF